MDKNPLNIEHANVPEQFSHFDLNNLLGGTYRFGEVSPHFLLRTTSNDKRARFMSGTETRSLNMVSPVMQEIKMFKTYGQVPMPAILPLNWEKLYVQPNIGSDIVASDVGTNVESFTNLAYNIFYRWWSKICTSVYDSDNETYKLTGSDITQIFRCLHFGSTVFSSGSLLSQLGDNYWPLFKYSQSIDNPVVSPVKYFDEFYDAVATLIFDNIGDNSYLLVSVDGQVNWYRVILSLSDSVSLGTTKVTSGGHDYYWPNISFRRFLELTNDSSFVCKLVKSDDASTSITLDDFADFDINENTNYVNFDGTALPLNLDAPVAYQLFVAEYMTNDKVDYVYSSELYRQVVRSAMKAYKAVSSYSALDPFLTFNWNGNSYLYDEFSSKLFRDMCSAFYSDLNTDLTTTDEFLSWWNLYFNIRNSLRYGDYFAGAKTRPLAPVDVDVPVVNNAVSMVNVATKKGYLRLAFAVNRIGRKLSKYSEEIMHQAPPTDYHHAWYLAQTEDSIGSVDTENTNIDPSSSGQPAQSTISNIRSQSNQYAFEVDVDIPSVIIGVMHYDISRLYDKGLSRFNWHVDRYDMFNPLLQFTGDQAVYGAEINVTEPTALNFAYQVKDAEYKFTINRCFGGLSLDSVLPGWVMRDTARFSADGQTGLTPSFIRSYPFEIDRFFISLTGMSFASYFHFIVKHSNSLSIDRPMVASPKIM